MALHRKILCFAAGAAIFLVRIHFRRFLSSSKEKTSLRILIQATCPVDSSAKKFKYIHGEKNEDLPMVYEYFRNSSDQVTGLTAEADGFKYDLVLNHGYVQ